MKDFIEISKNRCIFWALCTFAGIYGAWFFVSCFVNVRCARYFSGTISERINEIARVTPRFVKWKANRLLGEQVFVLVA